MTGLSKGSIAALIAAVVGALCLLLESSVPWLVKFPAAWVLPATDWVGAGLEWFLALIKPAARSFSALMFYTGSSKTPIFADRDAIPGRLYALNMNKLTVGWAPRIGGKWVDEDGAILHRVLGFDEYEANYIARVQTHWDSVMDQGVLINYGAPS